MGKKRISKKTILENVITMDMDTYKKNKGVLSQDDKVRIIDKDADINEEEEILTNEDENKL